MRGVLHVLHHVAEEMYDGCVRLPTGITQDDVMGSYGLLGFIRAVGSADLTHVRWECCPYRDARSYKGKQGFPTITYQATVDLSGRIIDVTEGFPGARTTRRSSATTM